MPQSNAGWLRRSTPQPVVAVLAKMATTTPPPSQIWLDPCCLDFLWDGRTCVHVRRN